MLLLHFKCILLRGILKIEVTIKSNTVQNDSSDWDVYSEEEKIVKGGSSLKCPNGKRN